MLRVLIKMRGGTPNMRGRTGNTRRMLIDMSGELIKMRGGTPNTRRMSINMSDRAGKMRGVLIEMRGRTPNMRGNMVDRPRPLVLGLGGLLAFEWPEARGYEVRSKRLVLVIA